MEANGVRLPPDLWRAIEQQAAASGVTRSEWLRRAINAFILLSPNMQTRHVHRHDRQGDAILVED